MTTWTRSTTAGPWTRIEMLVSAGAEVFGGLMILASWWQARNTVEISAGMHSAGLGGVGAMVAVLGNVFFFASARRAINSRQDAADLRVSSAAVPPEHETQDLAHAVVALSERATLYHRPTCELVDRKRTIAGSMAGFSAAGFKPCGICEPTSEGSRTQNSNGARS